MKRLRLPTCFGSILLLLMSLPPLSAASKPIVGNIDPDSLKLLEELVAIPSGTASLEGQEQMRKRIIPEFEKLGFRTFLDEGSKGRKVLRFQTGEKPRVMLLGHTDTVFVAGKPAPVWNVSETSITGPGVIDMKGGIVLMIHLLHKIKAEQGSAALDSIMVVLNDDEETGSDGSKEILKTLAISVSSVLIFEPGLANGTLISAH